MGKLVEALDSHLDPELVGGKAYNLSLMLQAGIPVPYGYVINANASSLKDIEKELEKVLKSLAPKIMVRSSAVGEDGEEHSFAGQLDSFLVDNNFADVSEAIEKCWESMKNQRSAVYSERNDVQLQKMGVVLQDLIDPDYAGVYFTHSPTDSRLKLCEYVEGHAEKLVSGAVTPGTVEFGDYLPELPFDIESLEEISLRILDYFGKPQDIEWALKDGKFYIVQSRPITALKTRVYWSNTNVNENYPDEMSPFLFSIAKESYYHYFKNIGIELGLFNVGRGNDSLEEALSNTVGLWGNKIYYNMTSIHKILFHSPFKALFQKSFDDFVGYQKADYKIKTKISKMTSLSFFVKLLREYLKLPKRVDYIENLVMDFSRTYRHSNKKSYSELNSLYHHFLNIRFHEWVNASFADFFSMLTHGILGEMCKEIEPEKYHGLQNGLLQALPDLISNRPIFEMYALHQAIEGSPSDKEIFDTKEAEDVLDNLSPEMREKIETYLNEWGYRCSGELTFLGENYIERPSSFIQTLQSYRKTAPEDPSILFEAKEKERESLLKSASKKITKLPFVKRVLFSLFFKSIVKMTAYSISCRERVRLKQALAYFTVKQTLKDYASLLVADGIILEQDDIFFLTQQEVSQFISGNLREVSSLQALIASRKKGFGESEAYPANFYTYMEDKEQKAHASKVEHKEGEFTGLAACGGEIRARVRVLESMHEISKLEKGDILVTRQTDPGWICAFPLIGGLIVENGGMLSHGAIVAREFGIPAVVGVEGITELLEDGEEVLLNGDLGLISPTRYENEKE